MKWKNSCLCSESSFMDVLPGRLLCTTVFCHYLQPDPDILCLTSTKDPKLDGTKKILDQSQDSKILKLWNQIQQDTNFSKNK